MNGHLVAVEVGVERGTNQRVKVNSLAFDQNRLKRLNAQTVQSRRAVQQNRMLADDFFQNVPDFRTLFFDHALGRLNGGGVAVEFQFGINERLKQFERHFLGQTALMQFEFRSDRNNRTARVVDALAEQVLTETSLFAFEHVGQRFQRTLVGAGNRAGAAAVVEQSVDGFLQHAFFVADDNVRRMQLDQSLQAVVAVNDAAIQIVQVGSRKAAAVQRNQRTQLRRNNRQNVQNHPFRLGVGFDERFDNLQSLDQLLAFGFRSVVLELFANGLALGFQIDGRQNLFESFGADSGAERILAVFVNGFLILVFGQQFVNGQRRQPRLDDDVVFKVQNAFQSFHRNVGQHRNAARQRF